VIVAVAVRVAVAVAVAVSVADAVAVAVGVAVAVAVGVIVADAVAVEVAVAVADEVAVALGVVVADAVGVAVPPDPVPVSATLCGLVGSLPIITAILALSAVACSVGVNVIRIVHDEFAVTDDPHVPPVTAKSPALAPPILPSLTDNENPDRFVTVIFFVFDGVFAVSVPNASVVAGTTVAGIFSAVVNETKYGPSVSGLSLTVIVADSVPN
jgi:hypothetical protein